MMNDSSKRKRTRQEMEDVREDETMFKQDRQNFFNNQRDSG